MAGNSAHRLDFSITVTAYSSGEGGGGGSLARGTKMDMANGNQRPVQSIKIGDRMLGYDPSTGQYGVATVTATKIVVTNNELIIHTLTGITLKTDNSTTEVLWTRLQNGTSLWLSVTQLRPGDSLHTQNGWAKVTSVDRLDGTTRCTIFTATKPYFANGYLDPPRPS